MKAYEPRTYRSSSGRKGLEPFRVQVRESDLMIQAEQVLQKEAMDILLRCRSHLENYIEQFPGFASTLAPWKIDGPAPPIIRSMAQAGLAAGVGPMAAVAGAVAQYVGQGLRAASGEVIVENGGDVYALVQGELFMGIFAGDSPLAGKLGLRLNPEGQPIGVCTSSASIGHSKSFGKADAVVIVSRDCALADATATAAANLVTGPKDVEAAVNFAQSVPGVIGAVSICQSQFAAWGDLELAPVQGKRP
ncbi:UPF0280 family protein [Desulfatibacillum aliphaticivorans]|uniref:UPF0280 family protein n=1 Tax=Desulfatibacillum aliphaticivorans TaxID=218208 RepID=UPI0004021728|nr:UPF0280 family protein [Desulfatibacillum aliphaticivorans]